MTTNEAGSHDNGSTMAGQSVLDRHRHDASDGRRAARRRRPRSTARRSKRTAPLLDPGDDGRIAQPQGPGPAPLSDAARRRERRRDADRRRRDRLGPARSRRRGTPSAATTAASRPSSVAERLGEPLRRGRRSSASGASRNAQSGIRRAAELRVAGQSERRLERGEGHLVDAEGPHQRVGLDPADRLLRAEQEAALRAAQQLVARDRARGRPRRRAPRRRSARPRRPAAGPGRARPSRCRRSSRGRASRASARQVGDRRPTR